MSWKLGCILIQARWQESEAKLLEKLELPEALDSKKVHITDTLELPATATAVAVEENYTMVLNRLLPYDLSYKPPFSSSLDKRLKELSKTAPVLSFFMDGITSTYGLCIFEKEKVVRARETVSARLVENHGKPYPEESVNKDEEARIFALTARWLGEPLDDFFFNPSFYMNVYDT